MIESADQYKEWFDEPDSIERYRKLQNQPASTGTWLAIVDRFPECRLSVARNRTIPVEVLEALRNDSDYGVQRAVRSSQTWHDTHENDHNSRQIDPEELAEYRLTPTERQVLRSGLIEWGGPARCTEELAIAMGFSSVADLFDTGYKISDDIESGKPMRHVDWTRALLATEIVFASNVVGSGIEWPTTTGLDDQTTLATLRKLQHHLVIYRPQLDRPSLVNRRH
ncbi:hypothetical protein [Subtercola frigoramans]|uniref:Uncharacterized protein n=1 Tax=Subtercola frigoramans TaxID=120298 RepID=A0ABS2L5G1_9MICO|nr:hypothetical protein [Subtercola frigoramans]MBM7472319.1 hypothetical protein [Subtercola frigoramans]